MRRPSRKASCPGRKVRRNFRAVRRLDVERSPSTWSRFATPSDRPAHRRLRPRAGRPPRTRAGSRPRRSTARTPTSSPWATSTSPATAPAPSRTSRTATASRRRGSRASSAAAGRPPERISFTGGTVTDVKVAAGDGNRLAVAWIADGTVYATVTPGGDTPGGFAPAVALGGPGATDLDLDLGVNGAAYAIWQESGNVVAARLQDTTWTRVAPPLDIDVNGAAGVGAAAPEGRRLGRGLRGRDLGRVHVGRAHARLGPPHHRHEPVDGPAGPQRCRATGTRTRPTSTSRTTAPTRGSSSARTSAASRGRSGGGCAARSTRRRSSSTRACPARTRRST